MSRHFDPAEPEMMDRATEADAELEQDLVNLEGLNRNFGSHRLLRRFLARWWNPGRCYRVLDLCTGGGDMPRVMVDWARPRDITLRIDAVESNAATLEIARRWSTDYPEIHFFNENALRFEPFENYDLVHSSLALHHFSDEDAARLLARCKEMSNRWVLVSDLERHLTTTMGVWLVTAFVYRDPMTVHDGRLSARRAFSFHEMRALAETAGWTNFGHARCLLCRQALWMEARDFGDIPIESVGVPSPA
jgi:SAM-dependent methyltransferase